MKHMDGYSDSAMREEIKKYQDMRRALGLTGEQLADLHRKAVIATDKDLEIDTMYGGSIMGVPSKTLAYLTDIALQHIALGWKISEGAEKRVREREQELMSSRHNADRQGEQDSNGS